MFSMNHAVSSVVLDPGEWIKRKSFERVKARQGVKTLFLENIKNVHSFCWVRQELKESVSLLHNALSSSF